jgi:hypothetical protein
MEKNPHILAAIKLSYRRVKEMNWDVVEELYAKAQEAYSIDREQARKEGMRQFLDEKSYNPGGGAISARPLTSSSDRGRLRSKHRTSQPTTTA